MLADEVSLRKLYQNQTRCKQPLASVEQMTIVLKRYPTKNNITGLESTQNWETMQLHKGKCMYVCD